MQLYDESILLTLASGVGRPIRVDMRTLDMHHGRFARIRVEIDLDKPVVGKICFRDVWYNVEYEGLHLLCATCGCYGHLSRNCGVSPVNIFTNGVAVEKPSATTPAEESPTEVTLPDKITSVTLNDQLESTLAVNHGAVTDTQLCSLTAHGEWLTIHKPKRKPKHDVVQQNPFKTRNKFATLAAVEEGAIDGKLVSPTRVDHAKKRSRGEGDKSSNLTMPQVTPPVTGQVSQAKLTVPIK
jgi:hypothetical protein